ncbi:autotransporter beta-domain protein [Chlamydia ibidis]|uniref:Autotransporter beta-domain protein n=2 Tax=Chlamydia ibidis TaxID=1405396 RepID=S7J581_9CHLA|nr:polymorphic outer membrane protein middle domain-containing protein [Chlamydia ibidis]EPP35373.1 autotransporter beta-domain protein [Chlamydia ibidis]EQM62910.1 autotransporter beta-domain protein [Chlamydia ibidis 10-1398/6]
MKTLRLFLYPIIYVSSFLLSPIVYGKTSSTLPPSIPRDMIDKLFPQLPKYLETEKLLPKNNLHGLTALSSGNLLINRYQNLYCALDYSLKSTITGDSVTLEDNTGYVCFVSNSSPVAGGLISATTNVCIQNNPANQYFIDNKSLRTTVSWQDQSIQAVGGGVIYCDNCQINNNRGSIYFGQNSTSQNGGAILAKTNCTITNNSAPIAFVNNFTTRLLASESNGGAICTDTFDILQNCGPIYFISNQAIDGGACQCSTINIKKNTSNIYFRNNKSSFYKISNNEASGGAIRCSSALNIIDNPGAVYFQDNFASKQGGALSVVNLTIQSSGPVYFTNNHANWGAGIILQNSGTAKLFAEYGDIVFENNSVFTNYTCRNAIHCTPNTTLQLGARKNYCVRFYDPIQHEHTTSIPLAINPNPEHQGIVLFSAAYTSESITDADNLTSKLRNTTNLQRGVLAIEDRAGAAFYKFNQTSGSFVRLGSASSISTIQTFQNQQNLSESIEVEDSPTLLVTPRITSQGCSITINGLALNLPTFLKSSAKPAKIFVTPLNNRGSFIPDTNPTITISGPLTFLNEENESPYDSLDLSHSRTHIPLLYLIDTDKNAARINSHSEETHTESLQTKTIPNYSINISEFDVGAVNHTKHYGHQGVWSPYWHEYTTTQGSTYETANNHYRVLYADWAYVGYIPDPKYRTTLVANTLWKDFYTTVASMRSLPSISECENSSFGDVRGQALGILTRQQSRDSLPGFHANAAGYSASSSIQSEIGHRCAFNFAQIFSNLKNKETDNKVNSKNYVGGVQLRMPWLHGRLITTINSAMSYGSHNMKTLYTENNKQSEGKFYSHSCAGSVNFSLPLQKVRDLTVIPFVEVLALRGVVSSFLESGDYVRQFATDSPLYHISIPMGIFAQICCSNGRLPTTWECELAYQPVGYLKQPKIATTLIVSKGSWIDEGTPISRNTLAIKLGNQTQILKHLSISVNYQGSLSSTTLTNYLKSGAMLHF